MGAYAGPLSKSDYSSLEALRRELTQADAFNAGDAQLIAVFGAHASAQQKLDSAIRIAGGYFDADTGMNLLDQINRGQSAIDLTIYARAGSERYLENRVAESNLYAMTAASLAGLDAPPGTLDDIVAQNIDLMRSADSLLPQRLTITETGVSRSIDSAIKRTQLLAAVVDLGAPLLLSRLGSTSLVADMAADSSSAAFDGKLYPPEKLRQLVPYLEKRGVSVFGTEGNPSFTAKADGTGVMLLPQTPTELEVKHELSHYLDFRDLGYDAYRDTGRVARESSVLDRLQSNRVWTQLNEAEKSFSIDYVERLRNAERARNGF